MFHCKALMKNISRNCSTLVLQYDFRRSTSCLLSQQSYTDFQNSLKNILNKIPADDFTPHILENLKKTMEYSVDGKQKIRGTLALYGYETLEKPENITNTTLNRIRTLAWSAEMVHSYFLILEDIENSDSRDRKNYGWYLHDACLFRSFVYEILKTYLLETPSYVDFVHLFNKAFLHTAIGKQLDATSKTSRNYDKFTIKHYNSITDYKTYHTFKFPVFLAVKLINNIDQDSFKKLDNICTDIGRFYQMLTEFSNCYGEVNDQMGIPKHSKDILEGRCSWLAVAALQRCTPAQRTVFTSCYGSQEPAHIERIKLLYDQLHIPTMYIEEEDRTYQALKLKTEGLSDMINPQLFLRALELIKDGKFND